MRSLLSLVVAAVAGLAGCQGAPGTCVSPATREIRIVDRLIDETRRDIERGYTRRETSASGVNFCVGGADDGLGVGFCTDGGRSRLVAIDAEAEQRKLEGLLARREILVRQQTVDLAACRERQG